MDTVGWLSIKRSGDFSHRYLDVNVPTFNYHIQSGRYKSPKDLIKPLVKKEDITKSRGRKIQDLIDKRMLETNYSKILGCAPQDYVLWTTTHDNPKSILYLLTDILADIVKLNETSKAYVIANSRSIRADILQGYYIFFSDGML